MNNKLFHVFIFAAGAAIGSVVTWKLVKTKYEQIAQEEIESVKEVFSRQDREDRHKLVEDLEKVNNQLKENLAKSNMNCDKPDLSEYAKKLNNEGYSDYTNAKNEEKGGSAMMDKPYIIPPEEFGDEPDHELVELRYFEDGVLTNSWYEPIDDATAEAMIGLESLNHFGDYEEDSVHVRNYQLGTDFEILSDVRRFEDIDRSDPDSVDE